jgi:ferrous iron transport protein A
MQLSSADNGKWVRVTGYEGGHGLEDKLRQLGLMPGDCARVLRHAPFGGPLMVEIDGRTIALGRRIAARIHVEESPPPCG